MFDRIAPVYDAMNRVMTAGLDRRWRRITVERDGARRATASSTRAAAPATSRSRARAARRGRRRPRLLRADARARAAQGARRSSGCSGDVLALPFDDASLRRGDRRLRRAQRRGSRGGAARAAARAPPGGRLGILEITTPRGRLAPFYRVWFDRVVPLLGKVLPGGVGLHVPARERAPLPRRRRSSPALLERSGFGDVRYRLFAGRYRRPARRGGAVTGDARSTAIREADGLEEYLDALEERLARTVASHPGLVAAVGNEALAAGGKRLRPLLVFLSTPPGRGAVARGRRRGRARAHGDARPRRPDRPRALPPRQGGRLVGLRRRRRARDRATTSSRARSRS